MAGRAAASSLIHCVIPPALAVVPTKTLNAGT